MMHHCVIPPLKVSERYLVPFGNDTGTAERINPLKSYRNVYTK